MCGNGIRAVAEFIHDSNPGGQITINTLCGKLNVEKQNNNWKVKMGRLYDSQQELMQYIKSIPSLSSTGARRLPLGNFE